jgi:hypothetical protein
MKCLRKFNALLRCSANLTTEHIHDGPHPFTTPIIVSPLPVPHMWPAHGQKYSAGVVGYTGESTGINHGTSRNLRQVGGSIFICWRLSQRAGSFWFCPNSQVRDILDHDERAAARTRLPVTENAVVRLSFRWASNPAPTKCPGP